MAAAPQESSFRKSIIQLISMVGDAVRLRLQLASMETKQFVGLCVTLLVLGLLCAISVLTAFLLINFLILFAFWDNVFLVGGIMVVAYLLAGWGFWAGLRRLWQTSAPPLSGTLEELKADLNLLKGDD